MKTLSQHNKSKTSSTKTLYPSVKPINDQIKSQISSLIKPKNPTLPHTITLELTQTKQHQRMPQYKCYTIRTNCKPTIFVAWQNGTRKFALSQNQHTIIIPAHIGDYLAIDIFHQSRHYTAIYQATTHTNHQSLTTPEKLIRPLILTLKHHFNGYTFLPLPPPQELTPFIHSIWRFTEGDKTNAYHIPPVPEYHTKKKKLF